MKPLCPECNGFGEWEFWGRYERCPFCDGTGVADWEEDEEEDEDE